MSFKVRAEKPSEVFHVFQILFSAAPVCVPLLIGDLHLSMTNVNWHLWELNRMSLKSSFYQMSEMCQNPKYYIIIMKRFTPSFGAWLSFPEIAYLFGNNSKVWDNLDESREPAHFSQYSCAAQQSVAFLGQKYKIHRCPCLCYDKLFFPKAEVQKHQFQGKKVT